jgi:rSAM/selenodomain-associated transferase 2
MSAAESVDAIAVVIPVLGDELHLGELLRQLRRQHAAEIAVVSGRADAAIAALCREHECRYVEAAANRGVQLDAGARATTSRVLWFVHADAAPPPDALQAIAAALRSGAESGCFRFAFQGPERWYKRLLAWLVVLRVRCGGMVYGDQGIFVARDRYVECGGFAPQPLFEEVRLVKRLRARRTFRMLPQALGVSTRRWERDGWLRRTVQNRWLALRFMLGAPAASLAASYRPLLPSEPERRP